MLQTLVWSRKHRLMRLPFAENLYLSSSSFDEYQDYVTQSQEGTKVGLKNGFQENRALVLQEMTRVLVNGILIKRVLCFKNISLLSKLMAPQINKIEKLTCES